MVAARHLLEVWILWLTHGQEVKCYHSSGFWCPLFTGVSSKSIFLWESGSWRRIGRYPPWGSNGSFLFVCFWLGHSSVNIGAIPILSIAHSGERISEVFKATCHTWRDFFRILRSLKYEILAEICLSCCGAIFEGAVIKIFKRVIKYNIIQHEHFLFFPIISHYWLHYWRWVKPESESGSVPPPLNQSTKTMVILLSFFYYSFFKWHIITILH